jgi:hypothetical protein
VSSISAVDLCSKGFLPKELPSCFRVTSFDKKTLRSIGALNFKKTSNYARHNLARAGKLPRKTGVPNPINHAWVAKCIEENWGEIKSIFDLSDFSCSKPSGEPTDRAIKTEPQSNRAVHRSEIYSSARYLVKADICRFYHSIYTHSIFWAMHSKPEGKSEEARKGKLGEKLDMLFRNLADRQTVGIPIGPDSSQIIAEMILCRIDRRLKESFGRLNCFRFLDDYEIAVESEAEANNVLCELQNLLGEQELELNSLKTGIYKLPIPVEEIWVHKLRALEILDGQKQHNSIVSLFDNAFLLQKDFPHSSVLKYALRIMWKAAKNKVLSPENYQLAEQLSCQCALAEASTFRWAFSLLEVLHLDGYKFQHFPYALKFILTESMQKQLGSELCWGLYALLRFRRQVCARGSITLGNFKWIDDPFVMTLLFQATDEGLVKENIFGADELTRVIGSKGLWERNWLFAYEVGRMLNDDYAEEDEHFRVLHKNNVRFFNEVDDDDQQHIVLPDSDGEDSV